MVKKVFALSVLALFVVTGCNKAEKYADVKSAMNDIIKLQENYIGSLEKAKDSKEFIAAVKTFGEGMEKLMPKMKELDKKYPEMKNQKEPPAELKPLVEKVEAVSKKMMEVQPAIMTKYMKDKTVQDALKEFAEKMQKMQQ